MNATTTTMNTQQQTIEISTVTKFRFVYSPEIETILREFAKDHEGEERKQFKQSWGVFMEENKLLLDMIRSAFVVYIIIMKAIHLVFHLK